MLAATLDYWTKPKKAIDHAKVAANINPHSGLAKHLYHSTLWMKKRSEEKTLTIKELNAAIKDEIEVVEQAWLKLDFSTEYYASNALAYFYIERYKKDKKKYKKDLDSAIKICKYLHDEMERLKSNAWASFLNTCATAMEQNDDCPSLIKGHKLGSKSHFLATDKMHSRMTLNRIEKKLRKLECEDFPTQNSLHL